MATQTFKLPLRVVQFAFLKMEHERDVDEIECLLANLIYRVSRALRTFLRLLTRFILHALRAFRALSAISDVFGDTDWKYVGYVLQQ